MTREEAIFCEKSYIGESNCTDCKYYGTETCQSRESHKMAIEALKQEDITWIVGNDNVQIAVRNMPVDMMQKINAIIGNKQEPATKNDLGVGAVSRDVVKEQMIMYGFHAPDMTVTEFVEDLPSVTPQEPKTGHWNDIPKYKDIAWQCSECKHFTTMKHNYCPNCGADMRDEEK